MGREFRQIQCRYRPLARRFASVSLYERFSLTTGHPRVSMLPRLVPAFVFQPIYKEVHVCFLEVSPESWSALFEVREFSFWKFNRTITKVVKTSGDEYE